MLYLSRPMSQRHPQSLASPAVIRPPTLRVLGTSITIIDPIVALAEADLSFKVEYEVLDFISCQRKAALKPGAYDVYDQCFHNLDIVWFWGALPAGHELVSAARITLADLADRDYIMLTVDEAGQTASRYWNRAGFQPKVVFSTSSVEAVRSMVAAGMGVTILSDMVYRHWSLDGQLIERRDLEDDIPTMDVGIAWKRDRRPQGAALTFSEHLALTFGGAGREAHD